MWLLGSGASASAGVPTAMNMIWEFKQRLYVSQLMTSPKEVSDLSNPLVRRRLQEYIDSLDRLPHAGSTDEYAALFEEVYPSELDRRSFLDAKLSGAKPSFGHIALATLMRASMANLVWTTNFDTLIADACAKVYDTTGALTTVALDAPEMAAESVLHQRWPVEVKLHGDFRSRRLKNTTDELRHQDSNLRRTLVDSCRRFGLVVVGYSGRDDSIMDTLTEALETPGAFPNGIFWLHCGDCPLPRVTDFIARAQRADIEAALVQIENFDEAMRDIIRLFEDLDTSILDSMPRERLFRSSAPRLRGKRGWPVVRLNALPIVHAPSVCRLVVCDIGGTAVVREAVKQTSANVIAVRSKLGVLAFGSDDEIRTAFGPYEITEFDLYSLDPRRQRYDSTERGLLREALTSAIERYLEMDAIRHRRAHLLSPRNPRDNSWSPLQKMVGPLSGGIAHHPELQWYEGIGIRLDWADDQLWLLFEPRTVFTGIDESNKSVAADLARERTVRRYNRQLNGLIEFWSSRLACGQRDLESLGVADGIDAVFRISPITGYSRRVGA